MSRSLTSNRRTRHTAGPLLGVLTLLTTLGLSACASTKDDDMQAAPAEAAPADMAPATEPAPADGAMNDGMTPTEPADPAAVPPETETPPPADGTP